MNIVWYMSDVHACGYVRAEVVARGLNRNFCGVRMCCKTDMVKSDFYGTDVMVFQRQSKQESLEKMRYARSRGIATVYDLDDDMLSMPAEFGESAEHYAKPEVRAGLLACMGEAEQIVVSTGPLAEAMGALLPGP